MLDVHPTGVLMGLSLKQASALTAIEQEVAKQNPVFFQGLESNSGKASRRALRLAVKELNYGWEGQQQVVVSFVLRKGCYATAVLRELVVGL